MDSLWGEEFNIQPTKQVAQKIKKKIEKKQPAEVSVKKTIKSKKIDIDSKLSLIEQEVNRILGTYSSRTVVIDSLEKLAAYIDAAIANSVIAIDTETNNSLDPITCKLMGVCLYTPNQQNAYIPINHIDKQTGERLSWQVTEKDIFNQLSRLKDTHIIMHNGKFDYSVLKCTCGIELDIYWDTMIAAKILDENEFSAGLKQQYIQKIDSSIEKYSIDHLFEDVQYAILDPNLFALYAATDAYMTFKLYEGQVEKIDQPENVSLKHLLYDLEMPLVHVLAEMEMNGMEVDQDYALRLSKTYHNQLDILDENINQELLKLKPKIDAWRKTEDANFRPMKKTGNGLSKSKNEQLQDNINFSSPTQLAILFYDVLKFPQVSRKSPRGTGEDELKSLYEKTKLPLCKYILDRRGLVKLISTYIDVIPDLAKKWPDGRVRTHFNQYGAATGRLSSSDPINFQNIPSHEKRIRMLFKAADGNMIIGSDFSAQEPRLTAFYSQDPAMIKAYNEGKDLYAVIGSKSFNTTYENCLEFYPEGTEIEFDGKKVICGNKTHQNKEGKERRSMSKSILLGVLYGRGAASVGEQIHKSREEAQKIIDDFYAAFPNVKKWIDASILSAHQKGYVEDIIGRRRRLPDALLEKYEIKDKSISFNPLLFAKGNISRDNIVNKYHNLCLNSRSKKDLETIKQQAEQENIAIKDNTGFIAQAERQAVNARVQGGAATLTKRALLDLYNSKELKALGAKLINAVHDEILIEAPTKNAEAAAELLTNIMINSAKQYVTNVPMKCDAYIVPCWYLDEFFAHMKDKFKKLQAEMSDLDAFESLVKTNTESTRSQIYEIVRDMMHEKPADHQALDDAIAKGILI